MTPPVDLTLKDATADRVRRSHAAGIRELQAQPFSVAVIKRNITIPAAGTAVIVAHGLGRAPQMVIISAPRMADTTGQSTGNVYDVNDATRIGDRSKLIELQGIGFTLDVVVDVTFL